jgi:hypothetical protein
MTSVRLARSFSRCSSRSSRTGIGTPAISAIFSTASGKLNPSSSVRNLK